MEITFFDMLLRMSKIMLAFDNVLVPSTVNYFKYKAKYLIPIGPHMKKIIVNIRPITI